jgi:hypothetical protein
VSSAKRVDLGSGAERQNSRSSSIGSEASSMGVTLCSRQQTSTTSSSGGGVAERLKGGDGVGPSNCGGGGEERLGGGEGVGPTAAPPGNHIPLGAKPAMSEP